MLLLEQVWASEAACSLVHFPAPLLPALGLTALGNGSARTVPMAYLIFGLVIEFAKKEAN